MAARWYIVNAYSNFEHKVAESIREQAEQAGLDGAFEEILVPTEEVVEMRRGRRVNSERKFFPGYVLVKMDMTDEAYHLVKNTPKVTGFLGSQNKPSPINQAEVDRIVNQVQDGAERREGEPAQERHEEGEPREVERAHVRTGEAVQLDLGGLVAIIGIDGEIGIVVGRLIGRHRGRVGLEVATVKAFCARWRRHCRRRRDGKVD